MAGPASQTRIVNRALSMLGTTQRITSINDGSAAAQLAEPLWDDTRDEVLVDHPWNFALERAAPGASTSYTPPNEYLYAYEMPADWLRWLPWERAHPDYFEGEQEGRFVLSNAEAPVYLRGIKRVADVALWSPGFISAMAARLAFYMAKGITGQSGMMDRMDALYGDMIAKAKRQDGLATGRQSSAQRRSNWLGARGSSHG